MAATATTGPLLSWQLRLMEQLDGQTLPPKVIFRQGRAIFKGMFEIKSFLKNIYKM
jgi:hypothetical protein